MDDLTITRLCAEAMGHKTVEHSFAGFVGLSLPDNEYMTNKVNPPYDPLHDDAQAMALVKGLRLSVEPSVGGWDVDSSDMRDFYTRNQDLNRAICECVAKMQQQDKPQVSAPQLSDFGKPDPMGEAIFSGRTSRNKP